MQEIAKARKIGVKDMATDQETLSIVRAAQRAPFGWRALVTTTLVAFNIGAASAYLLSGKSGQADDAASAQQVASDAALAASQEAEPDSEAATVAAPVGFGHLLVTTVPAATLILDGHRMGYTPASFLVPSGTHVIDVETHDRSSHLRRVVHVEAGKLKTYTLRFGAH